MAVDLQERNPLQFRIFAYFSRLFKELKFMYFLNFQVGKVLLKKIKLLIQDQ